MRSPGTGASVLRFTALIALALLVLLACAPSALALEPPRPGELDKYRADGSLAARLARARELGNYKLAPGVVDYLKAKSLLERAGAGSSVLLPPSAWRGMPTKGNVKILALLIDFNDWPAINSSATIQSKLFGSGDPSDFPYDSLTNYYKRSSYNQLTIGGNVLGWYHTGANRSAVTQTDAGRETLIRQALQYYDGLGHDFSQYDNDGDGVIDYFVVIWTGPDTGWDNFWWGYQTSYGNQSLVLDGKKLRTYSWQWECRYSNGTPTTGLYDQIVVMHETGHALGLPDYYDYDDKVGPDGGVGGLDMMDSNWGDHNPFSKWILDWITPQVITSAPLSVTLAASGTSNQALVVMPGASASDPFKEYFVVQNRQRVGNDSNRASNSNDNLPNDGLLVWHVDAQLHSTSGGNDYLSDNSYTPHKLLRLMEADGLEDIQTNSDRADAGDYYNTGKTFTDSTAPNSKKYSGSASNVSVTGIGAPGTSMTLQAGVVGGSPPPPTDTTPPVTTASGFDANWHGSPVTIIFSATDPAPNASGVAYTEYKLDGGGWTHGTSVTVPAPPATKTTHTVLYRSKDNAGNLEADKSGQVFIDTTTPLDITPPVTTASGADDLWHNHDVIIGLAASDNAGGSGVASITGSFDGDAPIVVPGATAQATIGAPLDHSNDGVTTLAYWATDVAGNIEPHKSVSVKIDTLGPVCGALSVSVKRGKVCKVWFVVRDTLSPQVTSALRIKTKGGVTKKSLSWGYEDVLAPEYMWYITFRCTFKKGTYRIEVTGKDLAGNNPSVVGRATLRVK